MKVSYIILPFTDSTYLVRCVNSLYRQLGDDYEVILAENDFGKEWKITEEFLNSKPKLLRISKLDYPEMKETAEKQTAEITEAEAPNEINDSKYADESEIIKLNNAKKLSKAFSLVSEDSGYVMLIDVTTVVSPICTKAILACEESDLIIPAAAIKEGDGFVSDCPEISAPEKNFDMLIPQRLCFGISLFNDFDPMFIENNDLFSIFLLSVFIEKNEIGSTEDICLYVESFAVPKPNENTGFEAIKEQCDAVFSKLFDISDIEARVIVFEKIINKISPLLADEDIEVRQGAFELLQKFYKEVRHDFLLKSIIETQTGFDSDEFLTMSCNEYALYKSHVRGDKNPVTAVDCAVQNKLLNDMKAVLDSTTKELSDMKKDVAVIKSKPITVNMSAPAAAGTVIGDPYVDIPKMYREGRLGFKTIWRSFWSWFKYKFSRKK